MNREEIVAELFRMQDKKYAAFQSKLIPTVETDRIIGVRTPEIRKFAKRLYRNKNFKCVDYKNRYYKDKNYNNGDCLDVDNLDVDYKDFEDVRTFLSCLPHQYFEENQLHAFMISQEKDFDRCIAEVEAFLPFIDNWATCDQLSPNIFKKEAEKLLPYIRTWVQSDRTYTVRFAVGMLMQHFLDERFHIEYADIVAGISSDEYYINMMKAWYFATALAKQYDLILPYLEEKRLDDWTHNKAIQKSIESYRINDEQKQYLRTLKVLKAKRFNNSQ